MLTGIAPLCATPLSPLYYNMPNGQTGGFSYRDDSYTCAGIIACSPTGNAGTDNAPLSGGSGKLSDGVAATLNWFATPSLYVGWSIDPLIEFYFAPGTAVSSVTVFFDDANGDGGVSLPGSVTFGNGTDTLVLGVTDPPGSAPVSFTFDVSSLGVGTYLSVTPSRQTGWLFISEVSFDGEENAPVPEPESWLMVTAGLWKSLRVLRRRQSKVAALAINTKEAGSGTAVI